MNYLGYLRLSYILEFSKGKRLTRSRKLYKPLPCTEDKNFCVIIAFVFFFYYYYLSPCVLWSTFTHLLPDYIKSKKIKVCRMIFTVLGMMVKDHYLKTGTFHLFPYACLCSINILYINKMITFGIIHKKSSHCNHILQENSEEKFTWHFSLYTHQFQWTHTKWLT